MNSDPRTRLGGRRDALRAQLQERRAKLRDPDAATPAPGRFPRSRTLRLLQQHPALGRAVALQVGLWLARSLLVRRPAMLAFVQRRFTRPPEA